MPAALCRRLLYFLCGLRRHPSHNLGQSPLHRVNALLDRAQPLVVRGRRIDLLIHDFATQIFSE